MEKERQDSTKKGKEMKKRRKRMNKRNARELTGMYYVDGIPVGSIKDLLATGVKPASPHGNTGWLKRVLMSYPNGSRG